MNEDFVTYKQAVKLKKLGFDWECTKGYAHYPSESVKTFNAQEENINGGYNKWCYSAPTLAQAAKWLREVKKEHIIVNIDRWLTVTPYRFELYQEFGENIIHQYVQNDFQTYEQALSAGIDKALELLKSL